jgi:hypothetical protein
MKRLPQGQLSRRGGRGENSRVWEECAIRGGESEPVSDGVVPDRGWRNWWILEGGAGADGRVTLLECSVGREERLEVRGKSETVRGQQEELMPWRPRVEEFVDGECGWCDYPADYFGDTG